MTARILGVHENAAPARTESAYPGGRWGREFVAKTGGGPLPESTTEQQLVDAVLRKARPHLDAGGGAVVSIKADMTSIGKGRWDSRLTAVGAAVKGRAVELVVWHEPEDDLKPAVFVPAHNRARAAIQAGGPGVLVDYAGMAYQWRPGSPTTAAPKAWAQDLQADRYLCDVYFGRTFPATHTLATHPGFRRWLTEMVLPYDRTWGLAEWGRQADPGRPGQFAADFDWLATDPIGRTCSMVLVWNTGGTENNPGWILDEPAVAAIRAGFARLAAGYASGSGYRVSGLEGLVISERSGCLVAEELTAQHDRLLRAAGL